MKWSIPPTFIVPCYQAKHCRKVLFFPFHLSSRDDASNFNSCFHCLIQLYMSMVMLLYVFIFSFGIWFNLTFLYICTLIATRTEYVLVCLLRTRFCWVDSLSIWRNTEDTRTTKISYSLTCLQELLTTSSKKTYCKIQLITLEVCLCSHFSP